MNRLSDFLAELKRRRVYRVAVVYTGVAFIISEIVANTFSLLHLPDSFGTAVIVILIIGFPIVIALAWAFDITDEGIVRAKGRPADAKRKAQSLLGNKSLAVIAVLAIIVAVWALLRGPSQPGDSVISSVAILPLENQMGDPEQEYIVNSVHEALTGEMSTLSALRVPGRTSTLSYKGNPKPIPDIAEELNVDAVVEGSVFRSPVDETIRITVQLVATRPERHIFQKVYEGDLTDILSIHKTIVREIAEELGLTLTSEEEAYLASAQQVNSEAYDLYMRGWYFRELGGWENVLKAKDHLEQAIIIDSTFAQAYAALGWVYYMMQDWGELPTLEARQKTRAVVEKALALDDQLVDAHIFHGLYLYMFEWDWAGAEEAFQRAIEINPNHLHTHYEFALYLVRMGRFDEALRHAQKVQQIDPVSPRAMEVMSTVYWRSGQYDEAIDAIMQGLELHPDREWSLYFPLFWAGRYQEVLDLAIKLNHRGWQMRASMMLDRPPEAVAYLDSLEMVWSQRFIRDEIFSLLYLIHKDDEEALDWLEQAVEERSTIFAYIKGQPAWYPLYDNPRFQTILREVGLEL